MRGLWVRAQEVGQRENMIWEFVQLSSGLWAFSQSVPSIMSWVAREVT